jgi:hypothetical protein
MAIEEMKNRSVSGVANYDWGFDYSDLLDRRCNLTILYRLPNVRADLAQWKYISDLDP